MSECMDPDCRFRCAHAYGRVSPRFKRLIDTGLLAFIGEVDGWSGFRHRVTQHTVFMDDEFNVWGVMRVYDGVDELCDFASPGEMVEALCRDLPAEADL